MGPGERREVAGLRRRIDFYPDQPRCTLFCRFIGMARNSGGVCGWALEVSPWCCVHTDHNHSLPGPQEKSKKLKISKKSS